MAKSKDRNDIDEIDAQLPGWVHTLRRRLKELEDSGKLEELLRAEE